MLSGMILLNDTVMILTKDIPVDYDDAQHLYSTPQRKYVSASQLVEKFCQPFDAFTISIAYAAKHGGTPEYWRQQWKNKNDVSKVRGNLIHDANEENLHGRMMDMFQGKSLVVQGDRVEEVHPWIQRPDGVYTERKLWHHGYGIAGRADKIIILSAGLDRYAHIEDYKTNAKLEMYSHRFKHNGQYKMMKPPLAHVMDCNWYHYCLQLSLYMLMLEYQGFLPGTMSIWHYPHATPDNPSPKRIKYDVPYMKKEVILMCNFINR